MSRFATGGVIRPHERVGDAVPAFLSPGCVTFDGENFFDFDGHRFPMVVDPTDDAEPSA